MTAPACHGWEPPAQWPVTPSGNDLWPSEAIAEWQGGRCAICGEDKPMRMKLDHCHHTGLVRGWLCSGCNIREGHRGDVELYRSYRLRPPSVILGRTEAYTRWSGGATRQLFPFHRPMPDDEADAAVFLEAEAARMWWWKSLPKHEREAAALVEQLCGAGAIEALLAYWDKEQDILAAAINSIPDDHLD